MFVLLRYTKKLVVFVILASLAVLLFPQQSQPLYAWVSSVAGAFGEELPAWQNIQSYSGGALFLTALLGLGYNWWMGRKLKSAHVSVQSIEDQTNLKHALERIEKLESEQTTLQTERDDLLERMDAWRRSYSDTRTNEKANQVHSEYGKKAIDKLERLEPKLAELYEAKGKGEGFQQALNSFLSFLEKENKQKEDKQKEKETYTVTTNFEPDWTKTIPTVTTKLLNSDWTKTVPTVSHIPVSLQEHAINPDEIRRLDTKTDKPETWYERLHCQGRLRGIIVQVRKTGTEWDGRECQISGYNITEGWAEVGSANGCWTRQPFNNLFLSEAPLTAAMQAHNDAKLHHINELRALENLPPLSTSDKDKDEGDNKEAGTSKDPFDQQLAELKELTKNFAELRARLDHVEEYLVNEDECEEEEDWDEEDEDEEDEDEEGSEQAPFNPFKVFSDALTRAFTGASPASPPNENPILSLLKSNQLLDKRVKDTSGLEGKIVGNGGYRVDMGAVGTDWNVAVQFANGTARSTPIKNLTLLDSSDEENDKPRPIIAALQKGELLGKKVWSRTNGIKDIHYVVKDYGTVGNDPEKCIAKVVQISAPDNVYPCAIKHLELVEEESQELKHWWDGIDRRDLIGRKVKILSSTYSRCGHIGEILDVNLSRQARVRYEDGGQGDWYSLNNLKPLPNPEPETIQSLLKSGKLVGRTISVPGGHRYKVLSINPDQTFNVLCEKRQVAYNSCQIQFFDKIVD